MAGLKKLYNSSITRVRPVFQQLINKTNHEWISTILNLCNSNYAKFLSNNSSMLVDFSVQKRMYKDSSLEQIGIDSIQLENCFEYPLPPSKRFLEWLIRNPSMMRWPSGKSYGETTQSKRKLLLQEDPGTIEEALKMLQQHEVKKQNRDWWVFEGYTEVDCLLETEMFILAIEGKRTEEGPSHSTDWYPQRNQLVRNLEVLKQHAAGKEFGLILIDEKGEYIFDKSTIDQSLPHFMHEEREELMNHYLGNLTWKQVCSVTGISYSELPDTIRDIAKK